MNKTYTLIASVVLFAIACGVLSMTYSSYKTKGKAMVDSISTTAPSGLGTTTGENGMEGVVKTRRYDNENVSFSSPQQLIVNVSSANQFIVSSTIHDKSSFVEVYTGKTGDCYMDFCKAPVQSTSVQNGITWDFLGNPEYCNGKECSQPSALYRTKTATKDIYLAFFEYGPHLNKPAIFSSFVIK